MRRNIYVKPVGPEQWETISAVSANRFSSRDQALEWAREAAQREFESSGEPWGVKVWGLEGGWVYDTRLGAAVDDGQL
jgi:hypothetical protein